MSEKSKVIIVKKISFIIVSLLVLLFLVRLSTLEAIPLIKFEGVIGQEPTEINDLSEFRE